MNPWLAALLLVAAGALAAICSGAETGYYAFSRLRHRLELERDVPSARRLERLFAQPNRFLAALLLGTTLALELVTFCNHALLESFSSLSASARATVGSIVTAPLLFVVAEALPKHAFLTRPYVLLSRCSWPLHLLTSLLWPIAALVARVSARIEELAPSPSTIADGGSLSGGVEHTLLQGLSEGLLTRSEHMLAANVLRLGRLTVADLAVPIDVLPQLARGGRAADWAAAMRGQSETRALVVERGGNDVVGMVHALDLALVIEEGRGSLEDAVRPLPRIASDLSVATALGRLHSEGLAMALVESGRGRPPRLLRVQDVVAELFARRDAPRGSALDRRRP